MPKAQRERREQTDNYHLILQWCHTPEQRLYEGIQPITLFGVPPAERAQETGGSGKYLTPGGECLRYPWHDQYVSTDQSPTRQPSSVAAGHDVPTHCRSQNGVFRLYARRDR